MAITFHCDYCGKKIEANEKAAGRWGKCPSCHNKIYVPNLNAPNDLKLAPVDEEEEKRKQQLMAETFNLEQEILSERAIPEGGEKNGNSANTQPARPVRAAVDEDKLYETIVNYLRLMADGDIEKAASKLGAIKSASETSLKLLDRIALADIPEAELSDIPSQVLAGLIRTLRSQLNQDV